MITHSQKSAYGANKISADQANRTRISQPPARWPTSPTIARECAFTARPKRSRPRSCPSPARYWRSRGCRDRRRRIQVSSAVGSGFRGDVEQQIRRKHDAGDQGDTRSPGRLALRPGQQQRQPDQEPDQPDRGQLRDYSHKLRPAHTPISEESLESARSAEPSSRLLLDLGIIPVDQLA
jgi:hypothetical protein